MRRSSSKSSERTDQHVSQSKRKRCGRSNLTRFNSIGAFSCCREACTVGTSDLCCMYRMPIEIPPSSLMDHLMARRSSNTDSSGADRAQSNHIHERALREMRRHQSILTDYPAKFVRISGVNSWKFDIFALERQFSSVSTNNLVCCLGLHLFDTHNLFNRLQLNRPMVARVLVSFASTYWSHNPYHTALHAADVMQAMHCFISQPKLYELLSPAEVLGTLFAAISHDADHPGLNQAHLEKTGHFLVPLYNSVSVLEQHHTRVGLSILHQSGLAATLKPVDWSTVRSCLLDLIPATDISLQGMYRHKFAQLIGIQKSQPNYSFSHKDRLLLLQMCLKCADVSNPTRPWPICRQWAQSVCSEFFSQGDQEKARWSFEPIPSFNRALSSVPTIQLTFINNLVRPLFADWNAFFETPLTNEICQTLDENYTKWEQLLSVSPMAEPPQWHGSNSSASPKHSQQQHLPRKAIKSSALPKPQQHNVKFCLSPARSIADENKQLSTKDSSTATAAGTDVHTYLITTRGLRRHSLPETQGAIRKTFNFAQSVHKHHHATNHAQHYFHIKKPAIIHPRTASGNIMQTLCEEIINHEPNGGDGGAIITIQDPFPLPDAWNPRIVGGSADDQSSTASPVTGVAIDLSTVHCGVLNNRRRSVPLVGYRF